MIRKLTNPSYYPIFVKPELKNALLLAGPAVVRAILTTGMRSHFHVKKLELIPRRLAEAEAARQFKAAAGFKLQVIGQGPPPDPQAHWDVNQLKGLKAAAAKQTISLLPDNSP